MTADQPPAIDPEIAEILKELAGDSVDRTELPVEESRRLMEEGNIAWNRPLPDMAEARDLTIAGPGGPLALRLLRPAADDNAPVVVYLHGGGFVLGSVESHRRLMRLLALRSGAAVLGVNYRLAPEAPHPLPLDDCLAAVRWLRNGGAATLGVDPERMVLAGDSAGANLALATLLALRDAGEPSPRGGALFYGCYWARLGSSSHTRFGGGGYRLTSKEMGWFWTQYLGGRTRQHPLAEPLYADLAGLPPLFLNYTDLDPLADDTRMLVERLDAAGVVHECRVYHGLVHGFLQMTNRVALADRALREAGDSIRDLLA